MKIVYIAHPISGDVKRNKRRVIAIIRDIVFSNHGVVPIAPYLTTLEALDDNDPFERGRGMLLNEVFFINKVIDELWLYGSKISSGMRKEIKLADENNIRIISKSNNIQHFKVDPNGGIKDD